MSIALFDISRSALSTAQSALDVTGNNIANVNTTHYTRQEAILQIATPVDTGVGQMGRGVHVGKVIRRYDSFLETQIIEQNQKIGKSEIQENGFSQIEEIFNEQQDFGLATKLFDYFNAWSDVSDNPQSTEQRVVLLEKANIFVSETKEVEDRILSIVDNIGESIPVTTDEINRLAAEIFELNGKISQTEGGTNLEANDLRDQRNGVIKEMAELVDFDSLELDNGEMMIYVGQRTLVGETGVKQLAATQVSNEEYRITLDSINITDRLEKGELGGLLGLGDNIRNSTLKDVRKLAATIALETNRLHNDTLHNDYDGHSTYDLAGNRGGNFFAEIQPHAEFDSDNNGNGAISVSLTSTTPSSLVYNSLRAHEYEVTYSSGTNTLQVTDTDINRVVYNGTYSSGSTFSFDGLDVTISNTLQNGDSFTVSPIRNAIANFDVNITDPAQIAAARNDTTAGTGLTGGAGDNTNALELLSLYDVVPSGMTSATDITSISNFYDSMVISIGSVSRTAKDNLNFEETLLFEMQQRRDSVSSVSLDEEAMNLIKYQKAYQGAARMVTVADEVLDLVVRLGQ